MTTQTPSPTVVVQMKTIQGPCIRAIVEAIKELVNEMDICFDENGVVFSNIDGTHMSMVHANIDARGVEYYYCREPRAVTVCVAHLHKMIKGVTHKDTCTLCIDDAMPHRIAIVIENYEKQTRSEAQIKLLDTPAGALDLPSGLYDVKIDVTASVFQKFCKDMAQVSDTLTVAAVRGGGEASGGVQLRVDGIIGSLSHFLAASSPTTSSSVSISGRPPHQQKSPAVAMMWGHPGPSGEEVRQAFPLKYLLIFAKATALSPTVTLTMTRDYPMLVTYPIMGLGELTFCLVPKQSAHPM